MVPDNLKRKAQKLLDNQGSTPLATLEATMDVADKLSEVAQLLANMPKTLSMEGVERVEIKGDKGDKGDTGERGEKGDKGEKGDPGADGKDSTVAGPKGDKGEPGTNGLNGLDGRDGIDGKDGSPDTPEQIRDKLETLTDNERLDISAIKGVDFATRADLSNAISSIKIPQNGGGSGGIEVFNATGKVGSGSALKFTGSGVANITNDGHTTTINISGGGGGTPGGSDTQIQYNNSGAFGGALMAYSEVGGGVDSVTLEFGNSTYKNVDFGPLTLSGSAGAMRIFGGNSTAGSGGELNLNAGFGDSVGGQINMSGGTGTGATTNGGAVVITGGAANGSGAGGDVTISGGTSLSGTAGSVTITPARFNATNGIFLEQNALDTTIWGYGGSTNGGFGAGSSGGGNVVLGNTSGWSGINGGFNNTLIGATSTSITDGSENILIGNITNVTSGSAVGAIAIGRAASAGSNQCVIGGNNASGFISEVFFGRGITSATARDVTIQIGGRSGTNLAGNTVTWASGKGTGNATTGGNHLWQTPDAGASGTTLQSLTTKMTLTRAGLLGLGGSSTPTHTISMQSTGTGIAMYNTADQTTNFERLLVSWSTNILQIYNGNGGTGTLRAMRIGTANTYFQADTNAGSPNYKASILHTASTSANGFQWSQAGGFTASSGSQIGFAINQTVNQTSTAGFTDLLVNRTQTAVGSGTQNLIDLQVGGTSEFRVDNIGRVITTNVVRMTGYTVAGLPTGTEGDVAYVTDQLTSPAAKGVAPTGGGSVRCMVFFNGTSWVGI